MLQAAFSRAFLGRPLNPVNSVTTRRCSCLSTSPFLFWDVGWRLSVLAAMTIAARAGASRPDVAAPQPADRPGHLSQTAYTFKGFPLAGSC